MTRMSRIVASVILAGAVTGCVSQEKYNALKLDRDGLAEQLGTAQKDAAASAREAQLAKEQLNALMSQGGNSTALVANLSQQLANAQAQLEELNRRYADAMRNAGGGQALPAPLTNELTAFANANPDLVDFDAARGIVKFKSDVTFAKGDATVTPRAKEVIDRFATILNSQSASAYELLVAGHTDNSPVVNPATRAAGHRDNWFLSSHRAISVGEELMSKGTNPQRIGVVGYADQRPVSSNASESGKAQNRRVEVLILPSQVRGGGNIASTPAPKTNARPRNDLNKDSGAANVNTGPMFNK
ncbi:MAG TPA: OmpA family protein [Tepidisphaeraceae bacterium]|nr:OmpA family protein [Tepidisphaeraceae bacterium]